MNTLRQDTFCVIRKIVQLFSRYNK